MREAQVPIGTCGAKSTEEGQCDRSGAVVCSGAGEHVYNPPDPDVFGLANPGWAHSNVAVSCLCDFVILWFRYTVTFMLVLLFCPRVSVCCQSYLQ